MPSIYNKLHDEYTSLVESFLSKDGYKVLGHSSTKDCSYDFEAEKHDVQFRIKTIRINRTGAKIPTLQLDVVFRRITDKQDPAYTYVLITNGVVNANKRKFAEEHSISIMDATIPYPWNKVTVQ